MNPAEIDNMWTKLGFAVNDSGKDVKAALWVDDRLILRTKRSHGAKATKGMLPQFIRQNMRLNDAQFADALRCPLDRAGYLAILREKRFL
jgi:hypothetical protein